MDLLKKSRRLLCSLACVLAAGGATAQVFAPGEMSSSHSNLKSLVNCDKCHSTENRVDRKKCLFCHASVAERIKQRKGFHGQTDVRIAPCDKCHKEHRGVEAALIPWPDGTKKRFDHRQTGWPLKGAHQKVPCDKCHDSRRIDDKGVLAYQKANPRATTYQGLPVKCDACHFDEHRGEVGRRCETCHDESAFKPPSKFNHDKYWPLEGAHKKVACYQCHQVKADKNFDPNGFPRAKNNGYLHMKPVAHDRCIDCHKDPHNARFGPDCLSCHTMDSWTLSTPPKNAAFHDKTAFPLKGRHRFVPCGRCHPKSAGNKTLLKPIAHDRCSSCHPNAHPDIPDKEMIKRDCVSCHDNNRFKPSKYSIDEHQKTRFPLKDAHTAAACPACHLSKLGEPIHSPSAARSKKMLSSLVLSPWRMRSDISANDCGRCHTSPHRDQFPGKPCVACHTGRSWTIAPKDFDHDRKTRFALKGKHRTLYCGACHKTVTDKEGRFIRYRPIQFADCDACHRDIHFGQFSKSTPKRACRECHTEDSFKQPRFNHNDKTQCAFPLNGKHRTVECGRCHPKVRLDEKTAVSRYRPTPTDCDVCHEDVHNGAYAAADALLHKMAPVSLKAASSAAKKSPRTIPESWYRLPQDKRTDCTSCHVDTGWFKVFFDHSATKFPHRGMHKKVACDKCHQQDTDVGARLLRGCAGCHADPHRGRLGRDCKECHTEDGFDKTDKMFARHNRTSFPLIGRHASLPCTECHQDVRDIGFNRTPTDCVACHEKDIPGPGESPMDHSALSRTCASCHTPVSFQTAAFQNHDRCFPIGTFTKHGSIACTKCHKGSLPSPDGNCAGEGFSCTQCHTCLTDKHRNVSGYECRERRCYECHRNP